MAQYVCKVGDATGRIFQQLETAQSEGEVRQKLLDRGFLVLSVKNEFNLAATFGSARRQKKIKIGDFLIFNQQFNTLIKAGLPILKSLDLLGRARRSAKFAAGAGRCAPARARWRSAIGSAGGARFVSARVCDGDQRGRAQRQPFGRHRSVHFLFAGQHRVPQVASSPR